jgi:hypothetical protein
MNILVSVGREQCNGGFGDVLRGILRSFRAIAVSGPSTLLKAGGETLKDSRTVKEVLKQTLKPTIGAFLGATGGSGGSALCEKTYSRSNAKSTYRYAGSRTFEYLEKVR